MRKGIYYSMLPGETPEDKFAAAARFGFSDVEIPTLDSVSECERYASAASASGIRIPSVMNKTHWATPMSDPDPAVRAKSVEGVIDHPTAERVGLSAAQVDEMYRYMAIANYEDRFVIPTTHRETSEDAYGLRGGCGFTFGNDCSGGRTELGLFGKDKRPRTKTKTPMEI